MRLILIVMIAAALFGCQKEPKPEPVTLSQQEQTRIDTLLKEGQTLMKAVRELRGKRTQFRKLFQKHQTVFQFKKDSFYKKFKTEHTIWSDGTIWSTVIDGGGKKLFQVKCTLDRGKNYSKTFLNYPANYLSRMGWVEVKVGQFNIHIAALKYRKDLKSEFELILKSLDLDKIKGIFAAQSTVPELKKGYDAIIALQKEIDQKVVAERKLGEQIAVALKKLLPPVSLMAPGFFWQIHYSNGVVLFKLKDQKQLDRMVVRGYYKQSIAQKNFTEEVKGFKGWINNDRLNLVVGNWLFRVTSKKSDDIFGSIDDQKKVIALFQLHLFKQF